MATGIEMFEEFGKMVENDPELKAKVEAIYEESDELELAPKLIRLGADYGFRFTETDIGLALDKGRELEPDEMELVSGGCSDKSTVDGLLKIVGQWAKTKCFTADCTVATPEGEVSIKDIKVGDEVLSLDEEGNWRTAKVTAVMAPHEMPVLKVLFGNGREWLTTDTQWFYCGGEDYACVTDPGSKKAVTADGGNTGVAGTEKTGRTETVYDFVVDGLNVFFVNGVAAEGFSLS